MTRVVFFGDSITAGQYVHKRDRWTTHLGARLNDAEVEWVAHGMPGETTRQALERFPADVQKQAPDVLTVQFGLNDCNQWNTDRGLRRVSPSAFDANLVEMVLRARHFGVSEVILLNVTPTLKGPKFETGGEMYSEIVDDVAERTGSTLCDVRSAFEGRIDLNRLLLPKPDLLHLSSDGHQVYADAVAGAVLDAVVGLALG